MKSILAILLLAISANTYMLVGKTTPAPTLTYKAECYSMMSDLSKKLVPALEEKSMFAIMGLFPELTAALKECIGQEREEKIMAELMKAIMNPGQVVKCFESEKAVIESIVKAFKQEQFR